MQDASIDTRSGITFRCCRAHLDQELVVTEVIGRRGTALGCVRTHSKGSLPAALIGRSRGHCPTARRARLSFRPLK
jgi:hypothetical protein